MPLKGEAAHSIIGGSCSAPQQEVEVLKLLAICSCQYFMAFREVLFVVFRSSTGWQGICEAVLHSDAPGSLSDASLLPGPVLLCSWGFRDW